MKKLACLIGALALAGSGTVMTANAQGLSSKKMPKNLQICKLGSNKCVKLTYNRAKNMSFQKLNKSNRLVPLQTKSIRLCSNLKGNFQCLKYSKIQPLRPIIKKLCKGKYPFCKITVKATPLRPSM